MKRINLLPKTEQRDLQLEFFSEQLITFWISVVVSLLLLVSLTYLAKIYLDAQISETEGKIAISKQILKSSDNEKLKTKVEGLNTQIRALRSLNSQHYYWSNALIELSKLLPDDIKLSGVTMDRIGGKVDIKGVAGTRESVLKFWIDIAKSKYFKGIDFPLANLEKDKDDPFTFSFYIVQDQIKTQ